MHVRPSHEPRSEASSADERRWARRRPPASSRLRGEGPGFVALWLLLIGLAAWSLWRASGTEPAWLGFSAFAVGVFGGAAASLFSKRIARGRMRTCGPNEPEREPGAPDGVSRFPLRETSPTGMSVAVGLLLSAPAGLTGFLVGTIWPGRPTGWAIGIAIGVTVILAAAGAAWAWRRAALGNDELVLDRDRGLLALPKPPFGRRPLVPLGEIEALERSEAVAGYSVDDGYAIDLRLSPGPDGTSRRLPLVRRFGRDELSPSDRRLADWLIAACGLPPL